MAQKKVLPAVIALNLLSVRTVNGFRELDCTWSNSCPKTLLPQQSIVPSS
jgi:hypothetical protein